MNNLLEQKVNLRNLFPQLKIEKLQNIVREEIDSLANFKLKKEVIIDFK